MIRSFLRPSPWWQWDAAWQPPHHQRHRVDRTCALQSTWCGIALSERLCPCCPPSFCFALPTFAVSRSEIQQFDDRQFLGTVCYFFSKREKKRKWKTAVLNKNTRTSKLREENAFERKASNIFCMNEKEWFLFRCKQISKPWLKFSDFQYLLDPCHFVSSRDQLICEFGISMLGKTRMSEVTLKIQLFEICKFLVSQAILPSCKRVRDSWRRWLRPCGKVRRICRPWRKEARQNSGSWFSTTADALKSETIVIFERNVSIEFH